MVERPRQENQAEDRQRAAEDVRCPAARRREGGQRDGEQARDHYRAAACNGLRREPQRAPDQVDLAGVVRDFASAFGRVGVVGHGLRHDRAQPERVKPSRQADRGQRGGQAERLAPAARCQQDARDQVPDQGHRHEERVRRMDDRERKRGRRDRKHLAAPPAGREREDERQQRRGDQRARRARGKREEVEGARPRTREAEQPRLPRRDRDSAAERPEESGARGIREQ